MYNVQLMCDFVVYNLTRYMLPLSLTTGKLPNDSVVH